MAGQPVGQMYVELSLDATKYTKAQKAILAGAKQNSADINKVHKTVGITSDAMYDAMRKNVENALGAIKRSHLSSRDEIVRAERAAAEKIQKINDDQFGKQVSHLDNLKKNWLAASAAVYASIRTIQAGWQLMEKAANAEQQTRAFENLTNSYGTNSEKILGELRKISNGTIDTMTMIEKAGTAMMMGIAPENVSRLMEIARATAKMTGQSVVDAFSDISLAVGRQSKMILDNLGIIVSVEKANEAYAKELGKTADKLTDVEKKIAFMNATLRAGDDLMKRLGEQQDTTRDKLDQLTAAVNNAKIEIGQGLSRGLLIAYGSFQWLASGVREASYAMAKLLEMRAQLAAKTSVWMDDKEREALYKQAETWRAVANEMKESGVNLAGQAVENFKAAIADVEKLNFDFKKRVVPKVDGAGGESDEEKTKRERRIALEREFLADYAIVQAEGQEQELARLKKNYENKLAEAKKYGASTVMLEKQYKFERDKILAQGDDYWKHYHELTLAEVSKADKEYFDSMADYAGYTYKKVNTEEMKAHEKKLKEQERANQQLLENIQNETADMFYDLYSGNIKGFDDMLGRMKDLFIRYLAEMSAKALAEPIILPIVQSITGSIGNMASQALGMGNAGSMIAGLGKTGIGASISAYAPQIALAAASAAIGKFAYSGAASMFGWRQNSNANTGAMIGGALLGPAGALAGGLAGGYVFSHGDPEIKMRARSANLLSGDLRYAGDENSVPSKLRGAYNQIGSESEAIFKNAQNKINLLLRAMPEQMAGGVEDYLSKTSLNLPGMKIGFDKDAEARMQQYQGTLTVMINDLVHDAFSSIGFESDAAIDAFMAKMEVAGQLSATTVSSALRSAVETSDFNAFGRSIKDSIYQNVTDGVLEALMQSSMFQSALSPIFYGLQTAMDKSFAGGEFNLDQFMSMATPYLGQANNAISQLAPAFDFVSSSLLNAKNLINNGTASPGIRQQDIAGYDPNRQIVIQANMNGVYAGKDVKEWLADMIKNVQELWFGDNIVINAITNAGL